MHVNPEQTPWCSDGLRDFFRYRNCGIEQSTEGTLLVQRVESGDVVHQRPAIVHDRFDGSPDMEYIEIVSPADFGALDEKPMSKGPPPPLWN